MFSFWNTSNTNLHPNRQNQPRCSNFEKIEAKVREARHRRKNNTDFIKLHSGYEELEQCAHKGCTGCKVVRQALLLAQITWKQVERLEKRDDPVYVRLRSEQQMKDSGSAEEPILQAILGVPLQYNTSVDIALTSNVGCPMLTEKRYDLVVPQLKAWLKDCRENHDAQCGHLSWSKENPRRLLEIISDSEVQLIDSANLSILDYVALSYSWGEGGTIGNTTFENLASRQIGFETQTLPQTIRDAVRLVQRLGLKYIWVDQLCIVQRNGNTPGEDWDLEGSRMHIVYGNAVFTLTACSGESSTDGLFRPRKAWSYPVVPFYFEGQWLINYDMTLKEVRARAPLSTRAWVLQEERLSPRLLYFCGQRFYWSCAVQQHMEVATDGRTQDNSVGRPFTRGGDYEWLSEAQTFLGFRLEGNKTTLHNEWQDLVEAYCLRNMTFSTDRFRAISGLAAQYLSVYLTKNNKIWDQEYFAGLWRTTFAQDLAWSVQTASDPGKALTKFAPSWSWGSLPLCNRIMAKESFDSVDSFNLLDEPGPSHPKKETNLDPGAAVLDACRKGAEKKSVFMRCRRQRILNKDAKPVDLSEIRTQRDGKETYSFAKYIDQHVYARDLDTGKLMIHEPTKLAMDIQLDYFVPQASNTTGPTIYVPDGLERDLYCLEIGKRTMLVVQVHRDQRNTANPVSTGIGELPAYRRVGLCRNVRDGFFDGARLADIELR